VLAGHPGATAVIKRALGSSIRANFANYDYVIGMAEAGIIWSTLAADELSLPHAFVRKSKKAYGRSEWIECSPPTGIRAVLIDDLTASGETLVDAIEKLSKAQITTVGVQSIVNWDFAAMRQRFDCLGMPVKALVSYPQLLDEALACHVLSTPAVEELNRFYQSPKTHRWNLNALSAPRVDSEARVS
jgi:orotate phosphoribosyltransferase